MECKEKQGLVGFVYIDENGNGQKELAEKGIKRTLIEVLDLKGNVIQTTETIDTGKYVFSLCSGEYKVKATYTQGENSYLERNEIIVSKDNFSQSQDFRVLKEQESSYMAYILIAAFILGAVAIGTVFKLISKRRSDSL